jgi:putative hydrolase of the HAD superfamily
VRAVILDRDGVLTHFDVPMLQAFFEPLVRLPLAELAQRWQGWCERGAGPRTLAQETAFWAEFWDGVADELALAPSARAQLRAFDYTRAIRAFPDVRAALTQARLRGLRVGVLSNFPLASLDASLRAAGVADLVDVACSASVIGAAKPAASAYLAATQALGVEPSECLFFDDEPLCVEGARALGIRAYRVDRTRAAHALDEDVVRGLDALPEILDKALSAR